MSLLITILGILAATFFVLAATNGLKRYVKHPWVKSIAKKHRLFGMLASFTALIHMVVAVSMGELRITGSLALLGIFTTGMLFSEKKTKALYIAHRIAGPVTFVLILIHIIFNSNYEQRGE